MLNKFYSLLCIILVLINIKCLKTFDIKFHYNYKVQVEPFNTQIYKRELMHFFDKASFSFNGFQKIESVPVLFPIDICVFSLEDSKYATTLHMKRNGARHFEVFRMNNGSYDLIADIPCPNGTAMDCINFNNKGYVAIALNLTERVQSAKEGSPIYEISGNHMRAVQYFAAPNLTSVYLRASGNDFFLLHTYANSEETPNLHCPFFKWSGRTFNKMGGIPCSNARQLTPFSIDYESYVAVANYADQNGRTTTNSEIYKYSANKNKFLLFQKIKTNGAVDVQYFNVPQNVLRKQHFLVFGNSISRDSLTKKEGKKLDADSVFYLYDKGQFIPYQKLPLYAVQKFLPIQNVEAEKFILLVACTDQDIKIYNFNDWKFEESKVQFTEGALGKGVSNMRIYQENEKSYLIIANNLMADNETNIFLPIFKQEQDANALRQKVIDWSRKETQRLDKIDTKALGKQVEEKLENLNHLKYLHSMQDIPQANIETVITESLVYPKQHMTTDYWLALNYINQALDTLEQMLQQKQRLKRDTGTIPKEYENSEYVYDTLNVKTLKVSKDLTAKKVNGVNSSQPQFKNIKVEKAIIENNFTKPTQERLNTLENLDYEDENNVMTVKNLQINGKLNEYQFNDLFNNTLKRKEEMQFLKADIAIENLKTDTIVVSNNKVNEQDLGALVPLDGGKYVINQDIQFAAPITVNELQILERLNNINVFNGQFDVLLKKTNKTQIIEGLKNVTNIKVLEPITVAGKMVGRQLEAISPNKFIHEPLILQGNLMINGDVHINHQLNVFDLIDLNEKLSTKQILDMAIRMDRSLKDINLKFQQQLTANNSLVNFVNQHDMQGLVKLNEDDIQVIEGLKVFNGSLEMRSGFSEVKNLNGVDVEKLQNNSFLKNNNQTIKVPIKMGNVSAKGIESPVIILNKKNLTDYLTITGNQSIDGSLLLDNLTAKFLTVEHLNTDGKIFNQNLQDIYQQKARNAPQEDVLKKNRKFHGSIYVHNLLCNSTINNKPVEEIENQLLQLEGNIKYVGNFKFNYPMNVTKMTFQGKLNDIPAEDFGKYWLQKRAEKQVFKAAQTFATLNAEKGILLQGKLNGFSMDEFYTKTYWINRDEYVQCANFENPIEITAFLKTKALNGYEVPHDVITKNSNQKPIFLKSMNIGENLSVGGSILNLTSINKIKLNDLQQFLDNSNVQTLYVENAYFFKSPPFYKFLNSHDIRKILDEIWLSNENVMLSNHVEIMDANFDGLLDFEGPINNINMEYLKGNYLSKTKPQDISVEIIFSENVESENDVNLDDLIVFGAINEGKSGFLFNFNEFVRNTLKTSGPHIISGKWHLFKAKMDDDLNDVLINQLNLVDDILRKDKTPDTYQLTAPKIFENVQIEKLYADSSSLVNKVPVANWIRDAVYLYENYTIKGVTALKFLNVYNNLVVLGNLNNITFDEKHLLLTNKNQQLQGNMKIVSYLPDRKRFLTNNIEHLYTDFVNGQFMPTFLENLIPTTENVEVNSHLIFKDVLKVEKYDGPEKFYTQNRWSKRDIGKQKQLGVQNFQRADERMENFEAVKDHLTNITKNVVFKLDHFDVLQTIHSKFVELAAFSIKFEDATIVDILAIWNKKDNKVTIFKWMPSEKIFLKTKDFNWLQYDPMSLILIHKIFQQTGRPLEAESLKRFIREDLKAFHFVLSSSNNNDSYFEFSNQHCIKFQINQPAGVELRKFCINAQNSEVIIISTENVQQIQSFGSDHVVLLTNSSAFIYDITPNSSKLLQKLSVTKPKQMALGSFNAFKFLAVMGKRQSNSLNYGFVEIYRSVNSSAFTFLQSLKLLEPTHMKFSFIEKSNDFLLHVLIDSFDKPYKIFQYHGVMGFREILSDSTLQLKLFGLDILNLHSSNNHLVALKTKENITIIDLVLNHI